MNDHDDRLPRSCAARPRVGRARLRGAVAAVTGAVLGIAGLPLVEQTAQAAEAPPTAVPYYFQTTGRLAGLNIGDFYTSSTGDDTDHQVRVEVPCGQASYPPIIVELYDPDSHAATNDPLAQDEIRSAVEDTTTFSLSNPSGTLLRSTEYTFDGATTFAYTPDPVASQPVVVNADTDGQFVKFYEFDPDLAGGCGDYLLNTHTGDLGGTVLEENDDDNSWRVRVNFDIDGNGSYDPAFDTDDLDGTAGTGDEILIGYDRISFQHGADDTIAQFWFFVGESKLGTIGCLGNFDLDGATGQVPGSPTVQYFKPDGTQVTGSVSGNQTWNTPSGGASAPCDSPPQPGGRTGDPFLIGPAEIGWWRTEIAIDTGNQYVAENIFGEPSYPIDPGNSVFQGIPVMTLTKDDGLTTVQTGDTVTYTITATNTSGAGSTPGTAFGMQLVDTLPSGFDFVSCTAPAGGSCSEIGGVVTFDLPDLPAGTPNPAHTMTVTANVTAAAGAGDKTNTAVVDFTDVFGNDFLDVTATDVDTMLAAVDLSLTKTDAGVTIEPGQVVSYALTYDQLGTEDLTGVVITETVPTNTTFEPASSSPGWVCSPDGNAGSTCTLTIGSVAAADSSGTVNFAVRADDPYATGAPDISNTATITDDGSVAADADPSNNTDSDTTPVNAAPDLAVVKTDSTAAEPVPAGGTIDYSVVVTNNGNLPSTNTVITDTPAGPGSITATAVSPGTITNPGPTTVTADVGTLAPGASATLTYTVTIDTPLSPGQTTMVNQAAAANAEGQSVPSDDPSVGGSADPNVVALDAVSLLDVTKSSDATGDVAPGDTITYTITATNTGTTTLTSIAVDDPAPVGTTIDPGSATVDGPVAFDDLSTNTYTAGIGDWTLGWDEQGDNDNPHYDAGGGNCNTGDVCLSNDQGSTRIRVQDNNNGIFRNVDLTGATSATLTYDYRRSSLEAGEFVKVWARDGVGGGWQELASHAGGPGSVTDGGYTTTTVTLPNTGGFLNANTDIRFHSSGTPGSMNNGDGVFFDNIYVSAARPSVDPTPLTPTPVLPPNETATYTFSVTVDDPLAPPITEIFNQVTIDSDQTTPQLASVTDPVIPPTITATKTDSVPLAGDVAPGDTVTYSVAITNTSAVSATGVSFADTPDADSALTVGSVSSTQGTITTGNGAGDTTVAVDVGTIAPGATVTVAFDAVVDNPFPNGDTSIANQGSVTGDRFAAVPTDDPETATADDATLTNVAAAPVLAITKSDSLSTAVAPGDTVTYTLIVSNTGNTSATNVVVSDSAPAGSAFVSGSVTATTGSITLGNGGGDAAMQVDIASLAAGSSATITFDVTVDDPFPAGQSQLSNVASADSTETAPVLSDDPDTATPSDPTLTPVTAAPVLVVTKTDSPDPVDTASDLTYAITYQNTGNQIATGVVLTETVPTNTSFDAGSSSVGWSCVPDASAGSTCTYSIGALAPAATATSVDFVVTTAATMPSASTQIANTVILTGDGGLTDDASTLTDVNAAPALVVEKVDAFPGPTLEPGENVTYTVTIENTGDAPATSVQLADTPDPNTALVVGSTTTSQGTVTIGNTAGDTTVAVDAGSVAPGATVTITFDVVVDDPFNSVAGQISNQATVSSTELPDIPTDDPDDATGTTDPTVTPVDAAPTITATKVDAFASPLEPGDFVDYTVIITNTGDAPATGVVFDDDVASQADIDLIATTVTTSQGTVTTGNTAGDTTVGVDVGTIAPGSFVSISFQVLVADPVPAGTSQVANQGTVGSNELADVVTDDPDDATGTTDPTVSPLLSAPDATVTKDDNVPGSTPVVPGDTIGYTITVTNNGNAGLTTFTVTDTVPAGTTFNAGASTVGWSCGVTDCTFTGGALAGGGGSTTITFAVDVDDPAPSGLATISNDVTVATPGDSNPANNSATETTPLDAAPSLSITKTDASPSTSPGSNDVYTVRIANSGTLGNQVATNIVVTETVPVGTTYDAANSDTWTGCADGAVAGTVCTFTIVSLAPGGVVNIAFAVDVVSPAANAQTQVVNTATITAEDNTAAIDLPAPATDTNLLIAAPDLTVAKSDGGASVAPGGSLAYALTITNQGDQTSNGSVLTETVPANTTFDPAGSTVGWTCLPDNSAGSTCTLALGAIAGGGGSVGAVFALNVDSPIAAGVTQVANTATITDDGTNGADSNPANDSGSDTTPLVGGPDVSILKDDALTNVAPGQTVVYTLTVDNVGTRGAQGVTITDTVPATTTFDPGSSTAGWACVPDNSAGSTCTFDVGTVEVADAPDVVSFAVAVDSAVPSGTPQIANTAIVFEDGTNGTDPNGANDSDGDTDTLDAAPDLAVDKTDAVTSVAPGSDVTYSIEVSNVGTEGSAGSTLTDVVPANTTFNDAATTAPWTCLPDATAGSTCTLTLGSIAAGGSTTVDFVVTVDATVPAGTTLISNTATVADDGSNGADPDGSNDSEGETTPINANPVLAARKEDAFDVGGLVPGGTITYTVTLDNSAGTTGATNVVFDDAAPTNTALIVGSVNAPGSVINAGNGLGDTSVNVSYGVIPAGETRTISFDVIVDDPVASGTSQISNQGTVTADGGINIPTDDPDVGGLTDPTVTSLTTVYDMTLTKTDGGASFTAGSTVVYQLDVTASGDVAASGVVITETVPANTTFDAGSSSAGWTCLPDNSAGSTCSISLGTIDDTSGTVSRDFAVTYATAIPAGIEFVANSASVDSDDANGAESNEANNSDTEATPVSGAPDLVITKADDVATSSTPGSNVTYTLSVDNVGSQDAADVTLTETVPVGSTFHLGGSTAGWSCADDAAAGSVCTFDLNSIAAGASATDVDFAVTVDDPLAAGTVQLDNTASVADVSGDDATPGDNSDTVATPITAAPSLVITKSDGGASATPGAPVSYTVSWSNTGDQAATGVVVSDAVPTNAVFETTGSDPRWSCSDGDPAGTSCTINVGAIAGGASDSASFVVVPIDPFPAGVSQLSNTASIVDDGTNGGTLPPPATDLTPVVAAAAVEVTKTDSIALSSSVAPGATVSYTIEVTNSGDQVAASMNLTDTIPANTSLVVPSLTVPVGSTVNSGDTAGDTSIDVDLPDLDTVTTHTISFDVVVDDPIAAGVNSIANQATVTAAGGISEDSDDPDTGAVDDSTVTNVAAAPDLTVTKDDGGAGAVPGGVVTYTVDWSNVGGQDATGVLLSETVPVGSVFVPGSSSAGWSCVPDSSAGSVCTLTLGAVPASGVGSSGSLSFAVQVVDPFPAGQVELDNDVSIADDGANGPDATPGDNSDNDTTPVAAAPALSASKDAVEGPVAPGSTISYTVVIANSGDQDDSNVAFTDNPGANTALVDGSVVVNPAVAGIVTSGNGAGDTFVGVDLATLSGGESVTVTFDVVVDNPFPSSTGTVTNQGQVTSDDLVGSLLTDDPDEPGAADPTPTDVVAVPVITATKTDTSVDSPVVPGSTITYTVVVGNSGTTAATAVTFADTPDPLTSLVVGSVSATVGGVATSGNGAGDTSVGVDLSTLSVGESVTISFDVVVDDPVPGGTTDVTNQGTIASNELADLSTDDPDDATGSTDPTVTPVVAAPVVSLTKTDSLAVPVVPGDAVTYTIVATNSGDATATNVSITDAAPAGTTFVDGSATTTAGSIVLGDDPGETALQVDVPSLAGAVTVTFDVVVDDPFPAGQSQLSNVAAVTSTETGVVLSDDPDTATANDPTVTPVTAAPVLVVTKTDAPDPVDTASDLTYSITYQNTGNQIATGVVLTETVPANTTFNAGASTAGWVCVPDASAGSTCTFSIGSLAPSGSATAVEFVVATAASMPLVSTQIANTVILTGDGGLTDSASTVTDVNAAPVLAASKTDAFPGGTLEPGETVSYTIDIVNSGDAAATSVLFTDVPDSNTTLSVGSVTTSQGTVTTGNTGGDTSVAVDVGTITAGATVTVAFDVAVDDPFDSTTLQISNQGTVTSTELGTVDTDDPDIAGATDPTVTPINAAPVLTATKTDAFTAPLNPGDTITYSVVVSNTGNAPATGIVFTDTPDTNTTLTAGSVTTTQGTITSGNTGGDTSVVVDIGTLDGGTTTTVTFQVVVVDPVPAGTTQISNQGAVASNELADAPTDDPDDATGTTDPTVSPLTAAPVVEVTKTDSIPLTSSVAPGSTVSYTLEVTNSGDEIATTINLTDTIPANTSLVVPSLTVPVGSTVNSGDTAGDTSVDVDLPDLDTVTTYTVSFDVVVDDPIAAGVNSIANQATVTAAGGISEDSDDPETGAANDSTVTNVAAAPDLTVTKDDGGAGAVPGGVVTYTVDWSNVGGQDATGVVVTETVPVGSVFVPGSSSAGWSCVPDDSAGSVCTLTLGAVPASGVGSSGSAAFAVQVVDPFPAGQVELDNDVSIADDGANGPDATPGDNNDNDTTPVAAAPALSASKDAVEGPVGPGATITYTVVIANSGDQDDSNVAFTDNPGANTALVDGSVVVNPAVAGTVTSGNGAGDTSVAVDLATLSGGESVTITFDVVVDDPFPSPTGTVTNQGQVTSDDLVGSLLTDDPDEPGATDPTPTDVAAVPVISATKTDTSVDSPVVPGSTITYTVVVGNSGTTAATAVSFADTPDPLTSLVVGSVGSTVGGTVTSGNGAGDTSVGVDLSTLTVGETITITFDVVVDDPVPGGTTQVVNQGTVASNEVPDVLTDDTAVGGAADPTVTPVVAAPVVSLSKTDSLAVPVVPGDTVTYTIVATNSGDATATNVSITDSAPAGTSFVEGSATTTTGSIVLGDDPGETALQVDVPSLAGAVTVTFDVVVDDPFPAGQTQLSNVAAFSSAETGPLLSDDPDTATANDPTVTPVTAAPVLVVTKTDAPDPVDTASDLTYSITYQNTGNQVATGVVLTETVPANTTFAAQAPNPWSCADGAPAGTVCTINIGSLAPSGSATAVEFVVTVDAVVPLVSTQLANTVILTGDGGLTDSASTVTDVNAAPVLAASKTDAFPGGTLEPGETVSYTIDIVNSGDAAATSVLFTDVPDANTSLTVGSVTTSQGTVITGNTGGDTSVAVDVGTIPAGATVTVSFDVVVDDPFDSTTLQIFNQGTVTSTELGTVDTDDPDVGGATDPTITPINAAPTLTATKVDAFPGAALEPGETITYTVVVGSTGNAPASGVVITDVPDTNTALVVGSVTTSQGTVTTGNTAGDTTVAVDIGTLNGGTSVTVTFDVVVDDPVPAGTTQISNQGTVASNELADVLTDDTAVGGASDPTVTPLTAAPAIDITKTDSVALSSSVAPGSTVSYTIEVTNSGDEVATTINLTDTIPANTSLVVPSLTVPVGSTVNSGDTAGDTSVDVDLPDLDTVTTHTITFDVVIDDPIAAGVNSIANQATVTAAGGISEDSDDPETGAADDTTITNISAAPDLTVTKDDGGVSVPWGGVVAYDITYRNVGTQDASNVILTETVPAGTTFTGSGWTCVPDATAGSACTRNVGSVDAGDPAVTLQFAVTVDNPVTGGQTSVSNDVSIADDGTGGSDLNPLDNSDTEVTPILDPPTLTIDKSGPAPTATVEPGDTITFTLDYDNTGQTAATGVVLSDVVPVGTTFVATGSDPGWSCSDGDPAGTNCTLALGAVAAGATGSVDIVVRVLSPAAAGFVLVSNTATIDDDDTFGLDPFDDTDTYDVAITTATIGDLVWYDVDGDGTRDANEPGLDGAVITLRDGGGTLIDTATTSGGGSYDFVGLPSGDYTVEITSGLPADAVVAPATPIAITLAPGVDENDADFAISGTSTIGDTVFVDPNADGAQQPGETAGVAGVTVELVSGGVVVATDVTDAAGDYSFPGLLAGTYTVRTDGSTLPAGSVATTGPSVVVLPASTTDDTVDFGVAGIGSIGDTVFVDVDENGTQSGPLEAGQSGIVLILRDGSGTEVDRTTSGVGGIYAFTNVIPGSYTVDVDPTSLPSANYSITTVDPLPVVVGDGSLGNPSDITDADIGINALGTIDGTVYVDADENGTQTGPLEVGQAGVEVILRNGSGVEVDRVTTGVGGSYQFIDVPAGGYTVEVDPATLPAGFSVVSPAGPITLPVDGASVANDIGINARGSIGDRVWLDADADGVQDASETTGISGVTVRLLDRATGNPVLDGGGTPITDVTDGSGAYSLPNLLAGAYTVQIDETSLPAGYQLTTPNDVDVDLGVGENVASTDFGAYPPASIDGTVFFDIDASQVQGPTEPGLAGVTVQLLDGGGNVIDSAVTAADGSYTFGDLVAGDYLTRVVVSTLPLGASTTTPNPVSVTVPLGAAIVDVDFGANGTGSIGDLVFVDADGDGSPAGPLEVGLAGLTVILRDASGSEIDRRITDGSGGYDFTGLLAGDYTVELDPATVPAGYGLTTDGSPTSPVAVTLLGFGADVDTADIGLNNPSQLAGTLFVDADSSGTIEPTETTTLAGVTITLLDGGGGVIATTVTAVDGTYSFDDVPAGDYTIELDTADLAADHPGYVATLPTSIPVTLLVDDDRTGLDFGANNPSDLSGSVWVDVNSDDIRQPTETDPVPSATGIEMVLFDGSGTEIDRTNLDVNGDYSFTDVPAGSYRIDVDETTLPPNYNMTAVNGEIVVLGVDDDRTGIDFGINTVGVIGDTVFLDVDGDGLQGAGETYGVPGVLVLLRDAANTVIDSAVTDASGQYRFVNVFGGDYTVEVDPTSLPAGTAVTTPATLLTLGAGEARLDVDFGVQGNASIGDRVWFDTNGDGIQDSSEADQGGVELVLFDAAGVEVARTTSAPDGSYSFDALPAGDYTIEVDPASLPTGFTLTTPGTATNPLAVTLGDGTAIDTADIGVRANGRIGDTVFLDADADGVQGPGEMGQGGIELVLRDAATGTEIDRVTSAPDGSYEFTDLDTGDYTVGIDPASLPTGFIVTTADPQPVTVTPNSDTDTIDFGVTDLGRITGLVFFDIDGDGVNDASEGGLSGVDVILRDSAGTEVGRVTVNPDGTYTFDDLPAGDYTVDVDPATLPAGGVVTTPVPAPVTLPVGGDVAAPDIGVATPGTISGTVWNDVDADGIIDDAVDVRPGPVTVVLIGAGADGTLGTSDDTTTTTTTSGGDYQFTGVVPGTYIIDVDESTLPPGIRTVTADPDGTLDGVAQVTVSAGSNVINQDFGYVNLVPDAINDQVLTNENTPVRIDVLGNDSDPDGGTLTVTGATDPTNGTVTVNPDGTITYTPDPGFGGTDVFTYTVCDEGGECSTAVVTVVVNAAPVILDTTIEGQPGAPLPPLQISDPNGDPVTVAVVGGQLPPGVTLNPDGTFSGVPTTPGTFEVTIEACDSAGACSQTIVTITIVPQGTMIPRTGIASTATLQTAFALLVAGMFLLLFGRRRTRNEEAVTRL